MFPKRKLVFIYHKIKLNPKKILIVETDKLPFGRAVEAKQRASTANRKMEKTPR